MVRRLPVILSLAVSAAAAPLAAQGTAPQNPTLRRAVFTLDSDAADGTTPAVPTGSGPGPAAATGSGRAPADAGTP